MLLQRAALFQALRPLQRLYTIEIDISYWLPQPSGTYQRMLVLEIRIFVPSIERVFAFGNGERTSWTRERHLQPRFIAKAPIPMKIIIPPKSVRDAANRSGSKDGSNENSSGGGAAGVSVAESNKMEEEIDEDDANSEVMDMVGSVDQWRGRYVHSHHPSDSQLWRHF